MAWTPPSDARATEPAASESANGWKPPSDAVAHERAAVDTSSLPMGTSGVSMGEAEEVAEKPQTSLAGTPVNPKGKSVFERLPASALPPPNVDAQKNLETMQRSPSPGSVMFTPGRALQQVNEQIKGYKDKQAAAAEKAAEVAATRESLLRRLAEHESYGVGDLAKDIGIAAAKGTVSLGQGAVGLAELATGFIPEDEEINPLHIGNWGLMMQKLGYDPETTNRFLTGFQSSKMQAQLGDVENAKGFFNTIKALGVNPLALTDSFVTNYPNMFGAGALGGSILRNWMGKAAGEAAAKKLTGEAAQKFIEGRIAGAANLTGHLAEGVMTAGQLSEQAQRQGVDWGDYVLPALAAGAGTALIGNAAGKVASKVGIGDITTDITAKAAGLKGNAGVGDTKMGLAKYVFGELLKEGLLEEMPQSAQEQIWTNIATGRPWNEGVPEASAQGVMVGGGMGAGHAIVNRSLQRTAELVQQGAASLAQNIARDGLPMTPEEMAKSKGFLAGKRTKQESESAAADALTKLQDYGQAQADLEFQKEAAETSIPAEDPRIAGLVEQHKKLTANKNFFDPLDYEVATADIEDKIRAIDPTALQRHLNLAEDGTPLRAPTEAVKEETPAPVVETPVETPKVETPEEKPTLQVVQYLDGTYGLNWLDKNNQPAVERAFKTEAEARAVAERNFAGEPVAKDVKGKPVSETPVETPVETPKVETPKVETPAETPTSTALVPVTPELQKQLKNDSDPYGINLDEWAEPESPTGLWDGATYYAGTPDIHGNGINQRAKFPVALTPITSLAEAKDAEANGQSVYAVNKPEQKTVPELEQEIAKLKGQRNKLLTPTGKEPKPNSKKGREWAVLTRQMDDLWGQITALESGRLQPTTPQLTNEPYTIDVEARVVDDEVILPQLENLSPKEVEKLQAHYGLLYGSEKFIARVKEDIIRFANEGANAVAAGIRDIIKKLHAGVLSVAIIFNPTFMSAPVQIVVPATQTRVEEVTQAPPLEAAKDMSPQAQRAYEVLYPTLKDELIANNKLFLITDKPTAMQFIFNPDGTLLLKSKVLLAKGIGDFEKGDNNIDANKITPAGVRTLVKRFNTSSTEGYDFNTVFGTMGVDEKTGGTYFSTVYHSVYTHLPDASKRLAALQKPGPEDSRYSFGCINVDKDTFGYLVKNHGDQMNGATLFVVPENGQNVMDFINGKATEAKDITRRKIEPTTQTITEEVPTATTVNESGIAADRRQTILRSIVQTATKTAASVPIDIAEFVKTNMAGVARLVKLFEDGKMSAEDFAGQMLRFQARVERQKEIKRNQTNQRMRGFGRVVKALEDAKKAGRISPQTADFAIWFLSKNPALASNLGIKIAVPANKKFAQENEGTAGFYVAFEELVRIITQKDPTTGKYAATNPDVAVHEILHHLERMLPDDIRHSIQKEWAKQVSAELKKAKAENDTAKVNYLTLILLANATNNAEAYKAASRMVMDGEVPAPFYSYFNPSEFWAVRGSGLLAGRYGASTRFAKAKQWIREFVQALRGIFGLSSDHAIISGLEAVLRGDGTFVSNSLLQEGDYNVPVKQVTPKGLHPDVAAAINRNDITGALRALARNTSGLYSVLASRLAELNLPTSIGFDNGRELVRQVIDQKCAPAQAQMFTIIRRAFPDLYNKYFSTYDKADSLEKVYEGLKVLESGKYDTSLFRLQLDAVREAYDNTMPGLTRSGFYAPSLDTINLSTKGAFGIRNQVLLHEVVHAATMYMLRNVEGLSSRQFEAVGRLMEMFETAKEKLGSTDYGLSDIYEFVAEALTNSEFQNKLRGIFYPAEKSSMLNSFIKYVLKMFGVDNVASAAMVEANEIFAAPKYDSSLAGTLKFAPPVKGRVGRYKKGPLTSRWRSAESQMVRFGSYLKDAITSLPDVANLGKVGNVLQRAAEYNVKQAILPWLGLRMIKDETAHTIPFIGAAIKVVEQTEEYRRSLLNMALNTVVKWSAMQSERPTQSRLMSLIMLEATIQGTEVDPQGPGYIDPATAQPGDKVAPPQLEAAWNALDGDFQNLYREVRDYYSKLLAETIATAKDRIDDSAKTPAEKAALKRAIDAQFAAIGKNQPYFPLRRFGNFWFQVTANNRSEFYTFESHSERDLAYQKRYAELMASNNPKLQEAARNMTSGNHMSEMYSQNKDVIGALKDVNEMIDAITSSVGTAAGPSATSATKTPDQVKQEIKNMIDQLMYVMLPQQSMRKMFINRRAIQGASEDMVRVFAESSMRSAYQQARFKYMPMYMNSMVAAHDYVNDYVKGLNMTKAKDYLREVENRFGYMYGTEDKSGYARAVGKAQQFMFYNNLLTIASALMNVLAYPIMAERTIGGRFGVIKTNKVLAKNLGIYGMSIPKRTIAPMLGGLSTNVSFPSILESGKLTGVLARAAKTFLDGGDVDASQTNDIHDFAGAPSAFYTGTGQKIAQVVTAPFHQMDRLTRELTLITVFELAYEKYLGAEKHDDRGIIIRDPSTGAPQKYSPQEAYDKAIEEARDAAAASVGEFVRALKARVFSGPTGSAILQFKQLPITIIYHTFRDMWLAFGAPLSTTERNVLKTYLEEHYKTDPNKAALVARDLKEYEDHQKEIYREAFRKVVLLNVTAMLMAGAQGTPMYLLASVIPAIASMFAPDGDEWDDFETWFYNMLMSDFSGAVTAMAGAAGFSEGTAEKIGVKTAHAVARGVPAAVLNWDLTERIGINPKEMLVRDTRYNPNLSESVQAYAIDLLGPMFGFVVKTIPEAVQLYQQGHLERAFERMFPSVAKPLVAARYAEEGVKRKTGEVVLHKDDLNSWDIASQALGIRPETVAMAQRQSSNNSETQLRLQSKKDNLLQLIWAEHLKGSKGEQIAREQFYAFAARNPDVVPDPDKAIEDHIESHEKSIVESAATLGAKIQDAELLRVGKGQYGTKKFLQNSR